MKYLRKYIAKDKSSALNLGRIINHFGLSILRKCSPYLQSHSAGNPISLMKNIQEILHRVPSKELIFKQKPAARNLDNPQAIRFSTSEYRPELPSEEDFRKAATLIGELLKPLSAELPQSIETAGELMSKTMKEMVSLKAPAKASKPSSAVQKEGKSSSESIILPSEISKSWTKQAASKQQGELPLATKVLIHKKKDAEPSKVEKRQREDEAEVPRKKAKLVDLEVSEGT